MQNVEAGAPACSVFLHRTAATSSSRRRRRRRRRRRCIGLAKRHRGAAAAQGAAGSPLLCSAARSALQTCLLCRALSAASTHLHLLLLPRTTRTQLTPPCSQILQNLQIPTLLLLPEKKRAGWRAGELNVNDLRARVATCPSIFATESPTFCTFINTCALSCR